MLDYHQLSLPLFKGQGPPLWTVAVLRDHSFAVQDEHSDWGLVSLANDNLDEHLDHLDPSRSDDKISPPIISSPPSLIYCHPMTQPCYRYPPNWTEPQCSRAEQGVSSHPVDINPRPSPTHKGIPTPRPTSFKAPHQIFSCRPRFIQICHKIDMFSNCSPQISSMSLVNPPIQKVLCRICTPKSASRIQVISLGLVLVHLSFLLLLGHLLPFPRSDVCLQHLT